MSKVDRLEGCLETVPDDWEWRMNVGELKQLLAVVRAAEYLFKTKRLPEDYTGREKAVVQALAALEQE